MLDDESWTGGGLGVSATAGCVGPSPTTAEAVSTATAKAASRRRSIDRLSISSPESRTYVAPRRKKHTNRHHNPKSGGVYRRSMTIGTPKYNAN